MTKKNNERWRDWNSQDIIHIPNGERTLCNRVIFNNIKTDGFPTCSQCLKKQETNNHHIKGE